jgi:4-hydroxy-tetrahydrodipicolinate synthase
MVSDLKQKFLKHVKGPVFPIPTPFTEDGHVDYEGIEKYVKFLVGKEVRTLMVTVGTSRFDVLTVEEMKLVNKTVVKAADGKALTIVTTPTKGPTTQAIDFVQHAESVGADGFLAVFPERYYSDDGVYEYFEEIAESCSIGVLIHLMSLTPGRAGIGAKVHYSPELVGRIAAIKNMVGIKEESHDPGLVYKWDREFRAGS